MPIFNAQFQSTSQNAYVAPQLWANQKPHSSYRHTKLPPLSPEALPKILVVDAGARYIKIGLATDMVPLVEPFCIARLLRSPPAMKAKQQQQAQEGGEVAASLDVNAFAGEARQLLQARLASLELRSAAGIIEQQCRTFNKQQELTAIAVHGNESEAGRGYGDEEEDDEEVERQFLVGRDAQMADPSRYKITYPYETKNELSAEYKSDEEFRCDLLSIITWLCIRKLVIPERELREYGILLVVPDMVHYRLLELTVDTLLTQFKAISLQASSLCAAYGCNANFACVVDVGANGYSVCCVEDGMMCAKSRIRVEGVGGQFLADTMAVLCQHAELQGVECHKLLSLVEDEAVTVKQGVLQVVAKQMPVKYTDQGFVAAMAPFYAEQLLSKSMPLTVLQQDDHHESDYSRSVHISYAGIWSTSPLLDATTQDKKSKQVTVKNHFYLQEDVEIVYDPELVAATADRQSATIATQDANGDDAMDVDGGAISTDELQQAASQQLNMHELLDIRSLHIAVCLSVLSSAPRLADFIRKRLTGDQSEQLDTTMLSGNEEERIKRLFNAVLNVGNGYATVRNSNILLEDMIYTAYHQTVAPALGLYNEQTLLAEPQAVEGQEVAMAEKEKEKRPLRIEVERVQSLPLKDSECGNVIWRGASIAARLDATREYSWLLKQQWLERGLAALQEKSTFFW